MTVRYARRNFDLMFSPILEKKKFTKIKCARVLTTHGCVPDIFLITFPVFLNLDFWAPFLGAGLPKFLTEFYDYEITVEYVANFRGDRRIEL